MRSAIAEIQSRIDGKHELWVESVRSATERMLSMKTPSASDVAWLASVVGQLAVQASEYSELRGKLQNL